MKSLLQNHTNKQVHKTTVWRLGSRAVRVQYRRNPRAMRYQIQMNEDGSFGIIIPHRGNQKRARQFAIHQKNWIKSKIQERTYFPPETWRSGTRILFRGKLVPLRICKNSFRKIVRLGSETFEAPLASSDLRQATLSFLFRLAQFELPYRTQLLAKRLRISISKVIIKNQKTRWGSCSASGAIALNWKLVLMPAEVRDYVIFHELIHRHEMTHSPRFWKMVGRVCPDYLQHEQWLKDNRNYLCI